MSGAPAAARLDDPVAHSHALAGFLAGAVVGFVAAAEAAAVIGAVVGAVALEVTTAGLATPLVVGVAATALELGVGGYVGAKLMGGAEETGEALGSQSLGAASGKVAQGSPNVRTNGRPAAHALDAETCHAGQVAQGSKLVRINGLPASRVGDKTTCGAQISAGSANVRIGGPPDTRAGIQSEVPEWVRWATLVVTILPALGEAGRLAGPILREVEASGLPRAMMTGVKALGRALEERGGGGVGPEPVAEPPSPVTPGEPAPPPVASAEPPPSLYRVDGRPPSTIFEEGFQPKGTSTDLKAYVDTNNPSGFVSTSKSADIANNPDFASSGKYVYEIDSSQVSGIDVNEAYPQNPYAHEQEIAVTGGVPNEAILSAKPILPGGGLGNAIPNPGYGAGR